MAGAAASENPTVTRVCPPGTEPDLTAPVVAVEVDPAAPSGLDGWYAGPVSVTVTASDAGSGVASIELREPDGDWARYTGAISVPDGDHTYLFRATDHAGHSSEPGSVSVKRDATAPTLTWNGTIGSGDRFVFGSVPAAPTCTADDDTSGAAGCVVTGYSSAVGTHALTATATDRAGNTLEVTRTYEVTPWELHGFQSPVDMGGVVNTVRAGATVPLRFEVFAGGTERTSTTSVTGIASTQVACDGNAPLDEIETTATGATALRYDDAAGVFVFNWKTPSQDGCYQVRVSTADGSALTASFRLR